LTSGKSRAQAAVLRWCDAVICNSRAAAEGLVRRGVPEPRLIVIPNGLPEAAFAPQPPAIARVPGTIRAVMLARMNTRSKNHSLLLRATARLRDRMPNLEVLLVGDGPLRPDLEREAEALGIRDRVQFLGERHDVAAVLRSADISVLPSISESLSNAIIESMAAELPVVACRVGGNPELVNEQTGMLVAPDNEEEFAEAIANLARNPAKRVELGDAARKIACAQYTIAGMCQRHEALYAELLERKQWQPMRTHFLPGAKRLSVAVVAASLRYVGGQSVQADLLLRNWRVDSAVDARLIPIDPPMPRWLGWVERIPGLRTLVREPFYLSALWRGLKGVEVAHIFSASYSSFLIAPAQAWLIARLRGKKTVVHYHSGEARDHLSKSAIARSVLRRADKLAVPSGYLVDVFREFGLVATAVPNIVDLQQFSFRRRSSLRPHLVCTRGFHPYYAVDVVVRAFAEIRNSWPEARLDLVGGGPTEPQIRALVRELNLDGVTFSGVAPRDTIGQYYDAADIFVNASWLDNMPVSVMEAFACGTPVVSTSPEGMSYLVEHERTGLLSEPGDAHALAENVLRLLNDPTLASHLAQQAYEESRRFDWKIVREQWLQVYGVAASRDHTAANEVFTAAGSSRQ
jgi:L-malate glycosyltransferase